jgi:4-aminobutyrate aminotransferase/(S)-3-amino-2-methylpropionate transaminase
VDPDIVIMGKSLSAGLPLSGCLVSEEVASANPAGSESSTYAGNLVSCAAALAALDVYEADGMSEVASGAGTMLLDLLQVSLGDLPVVGEIRGRGLMVAVELVRDRATREPAAIARRISDACVQRGLLVYPGGHFGNVVAMLPPLVATDDQYRTAVELLASVIGDHA